MSLQIPVKIIIGILFIIYFSGCATTTQLTGSWKESGVINKPGHVLVIGISKNSVARRTYESALVNKLNEQGVNAVTAASIFPADQKIDRPLIVDAVKKHGFDSVLVTRVVGKDKEVNYVPGMTYVVPHRSYNDFHNYYGSYGHVVHEPGYVYTETIVSLETNLYETKADKLIWAITTESVNPNKIDKEINSLAELIIEQLVKDGLIGG